jgi:CheY-specific phosphatase CheX
MATTEAQILGDIQNAVAETFKVQMSLETTIKAISAQVDEKKEDRIAVEVGSVMGVKGKGHTGTIAIAFPKTTFLGIVESMLGEKHAEISNQNADACSELLNIIYASARVKINAGGFEFQPAIPATVCGKDIWFPLGQFKEYIRLECECNKGKFILAFVLKRT